MGEARVEKRNRPPKSCELCRVRKLKCNRALPCDTCTKRGKGSSCYYAPNADRTDKRETQRESVNDRLKSLESLISSLARKGVTPDVSVPAEASSPVQQTAEDTEMGGGEVPPTPDTEVPTKDAAELPAGILANGVQSSYVDSNHWSSILEDIRGIREQLSFSSTQEQEPTVELLTPSTDWTLGTEPPAETDLIFGSTETVNLQQILSTVPSRQVCDSLVSNYFQSRYTVLPILHPAKFQQEYEDFWRAPTAVHPVWLGLLFAVLSLGSGIHELSTIARGSQRFLPSAKMLSNRTEQCLVIGGYAKSRAHAVEALMIHVQSCYLRAKESDVNLWFLMGAVIRLAIRMGYHRDPSRFPNSTLSPFDGEMRRRVWISIFQIDALMSFQMGLPSMIPTEDCDTELPRNLDYSDFSPESPVLPPSRPETDYTHILYTIAKTPVMLMFKTVVSHIRSLRPPPYEKTLALDEKLRTTYSGLPDALKFRPLRQSVVDSPGLIMNRSTIEILHLKSIIVLHRQYITTHRQDTRYDRSRHACLEAALCILDRQAEWCQATQPGGQFYEDRWMVTALTTNDFILAVMVICLELTIRTKVTDGALGYSVSTAVGGNDKDLERYFAAIQVGHEIWIAASAFSTEARITARAIDLTIQRVRASLNAAATTTASSLQLPTASTAYGDARTQGLSPSLDGMEFIDWSLLDNYLQDIPPEDVDLNSWILDAAGAPGPHNPLYSQPPV